MQIFKYKATNKGNKTVSGLVEADSEEAAIDLLKEKNLDIISLEKTGGKGSGGFSIVIGGIKAKELVAFSRQFSVLISANVALVQSLKLLTEQTKNLKLKMAISEIADDIDEGVRLSDAFAKKPHIFSKFYVNVVRSGETSGKLDEVLNYLADELEKDYDMASKIKGAMIYPAFVFCGLGIVGVIMMIFVVPKLTAVISETGGELPVATKVLIAVSDFLAGFWWLLLILLVGAVVGFKVLKKVPAVKKNIDKILLHLPVFGRLFRLIYLVRFTRSLHTLLIGGVNISKGLLIVSEVVENQVYKDLILATKKEIEDGNSISLVFSNSKEIPSMVSQMMNIGEKTGKLDVILECITDFYGREVNNMVANLMTLMEPIIMVVMGIGVGLMVAAIILPMYQMSSNF
ncbi:type II secretion system F family protein [Candidatus Parcubacteria bacterium]|nr:type II secretion system F family protein [Candidatus Parcubacteria bacterium]